MKITKETIRDFETYLAEDEKSKATIEKYTRDVKAFAAALHGADADKAAVIRYKRRLAERYKTSSVNSMLSSLNSFFLFAERGDLRVKTFRTQRAVFAESGRELTYDEYNRLLDAAKRSGNKRLYFIIMTICSTGIRVSELEYITVEAVRNGYTDVVCKNKTRRIMLPSDLCRKLERYIREIGISDGCVFITKTGTPVNRVNIWTDMKKLCKSADVTKSKIFPHNLRHLFAVTFYSVSGDIVKLSDIMGHSSIETTRIYTMESGMNHRRILDKMNLTAARQSPVQNSRLVIDKRGGL